MTLPLLVPVTARKFVQHVIFAALRLTAKIRAWHASPIQINTHSAKLSSTESDKGTGVACLILRQPISSIGTDTATAMATQQRALATVLRAKRVTSCSA